MCGVVGVLKKPNEKFTTKDFYSFLTMLEMAESRGSQATGLFYVFNDGSTRTIKTDATASLVVDYVPMLSNVKAMVGHTRASTGGTPAQNENNHPHEAGNWVLVHNGMCDSELPRNILKLETLCDTEEIVQTLRHFEEVINVDNEEDLFKKSFETISGSWTLCFANTKTGKLYLTTNGRSPLHCMFTADSFLFASETRFIKSTSIYTTKEEDENLYTEIVLPGGASVKEYAIFEPKEDIVFDVTDPFTLSVVSEYTCAIGYGYGRATGNWRDYSDTTDYGFSSHDHNNYYQSRGYNATTQTPGGYEKPKTKKRNAEHNNVMDDAEYTIMDNMFLRDSVVFDLSKNELIPTSLYSDMKLEEFALANLVGYPETYGLSERQATKVNRAYNNGHKQLTKKIRKKIFDKFQDKFADLVFEYLEQQGENFSESKLDVWSLLSPSADKASDTVMKQFNWAYAVLAIQYEFDFRIDNAYSSFESYTIPTEESIESLPMSTFFCNQCLIQRHYYTDANGEEMHICPCCYSEFSAPKSFIEE